MALFGAGTWSPTLLTIIVGAAAWRIIPWLVWTYRQWSALPPGPKGMPIVGNVFQMMTPKTWLLLTEWTKTYGPIYSLNIVGIPVVVIGSAEVAADLLDRRADSFSDRPRFVMGSELMSREKFVLYTPYNAHFIRLRRAVQDGFSSRAVKAYSPIQEREAAIMLRNFMKDPAGWEQELERASSGVILSTLYGWPSISSVSHPAVVGVNKILREIEIASMPGASLVDIFPALLRLPKPLSKWKQRGDQLYHEFTALFTGLLEGVKQNEAQVSLTRSSPPSLLLDRIAQGEMSLEDAAWMAGTLFAGGAETTAVILKMFVLNMVMRPEIMGRAQAEIDLVVGRDRMPTMDDRDRLPYLTAVIREVIRWYTISIYAMPRQCKQDEWYRGYLIPKGSIVLPNVWGIQRDPAVYGDADAFRPERFLDENGAHNVVVADTHGHGHVTFGFGKRMCPGSYLANQTLFISAASLLWAFTFKNPVDKSGRPLVSADDSIASNGILIHPIPFRCEFVPRSEQVQILIAARELERS
ncbi:cytochrome P450 [Trametopsis cervina]|nr:cytochrome P450 [Trametopsis cervina]